MFIEPPAKKKEPEKRRYLLTRSSGNPRDINLIWLDFHGTCNKYHADVKGNLYPARFHMYRSDSGALYGVLCPNSLEPEEWARVGVDDPVGAWRAHYLSFKNEKPVVKKNYEPTSL